MTSCSLLTPESAAGQPPARIGGKAAGLLRLQESGARVPPWAVLPVLAVQQQCWEQEAVALVLHTLFARLAAPPFSGVMARSSAPDEDTAHRSRAGQYHSERVTRQEDLPGAMQRVAESAGGGPMAIVLQAAVPAKLAGVLFSANPAAAQLEEACLEVVTGSGERLVSGRAAPSAASLDLARETAREWTPGEDGPDALPPTLDAALCQLLLAAERAFDRALDIEWVWADETLWAVQARPMTALRPAPALLPGCCATCWFFEQRFLEPIRPITFTTLLPLIVQTGFEPVLPAGRAAAGSSLVRFGGQAYISHTLYLSMLGFLPRRLLTAELRTLFPRHCGCSRKDTWKGAIRTGRFALRHALEPFRNIRRWDAFAESLEERLGQIETPRPDCPDAWMRAWSALDSLVADFLRIHRWSVVLAEFRYTLFRWCGRFLLKRWAAQRDQRLLERLCLPTREANRWLARVASAGDDPTVRAAFVQRFGHRSNALDYAAPTWAELLAQDALPSAGLTPGSPETGTAPRASAGRRGALQRLLEMREEQRFECEKILARQRRMLLDAARHLHARGLLEDPEDVWWLEWDALRAALLRGIAPDARAIALRRHAAHVEAMMETPLFIGPQAMRESVPGQVLQGIGASAGRVTGRAVLAPAPASAPPFPEGAVIAVLPALDPGQSHLLERVSGLVVERGGLLSHAAVLAREYRVPLVIGVRDALRRIPEGALLTLDGETGEVHVILEAPSQKT